MFLFFNEFLCFELFVNIYGLKKENILTWVNLLCSGLQKWSFTATNKGKTHHLKHKKCTKLTYNLMH